jgi:trimethylamine--corrinoid protein Co-methyltransferase
MVIDADILQGVQRLRRGVAVSRDTLGEEAIERVGPGGDFLMDSHTLQWMRSDEYWLSPLANRQGTTGQTMLERAHERVEALLAEHTPSVSPEVVADVEAYVREAEDVAQ